MSIGTIAVPVPAQGLGTPVDVSDIVGQKTVQLSGTFDGYYDLLASQNDANYVAIASFNAGGAAGIKVTIDGAIKTVLLRSTAFSAIGVSCNLSGIIGTGQNGFGSIATVPVGFSGLTAPVDTATFLPPTGSEADTCLLCSGSFEGVITVLGSNDGVDYNPVGEFRVARRPDGSPPDFSLPPLQISAKVRYVRLLVEAVVTGNTVVTLGGRVPAGSYPPSGPAGGDLEGTYPNPTVKPIAVQTKVSVTNMASLRILESKDGSIILEGYYTQNDGGGGVFTWDASSTSVDNNGTIIMPTGHVGPGRWLRLWSGEINVRWFGAKGNGIANDRPAIVNAQNALYVSGGILFFPPGTYNIDQRLQPASGYIWRGTSSYQQLLGLASRIVLTMDDESVIDVGTQKFTAEHLWFEGNQHATKGVAHFPGIGSTWLTTFTDCVFSGPKLPSAGGLGHALLIDGSSQVDDCTFDRCQFWASSTDGTVKTDVLVKIVANTNALLNVFRKCSFWGATHSGFQILAGSATVVDCDFGGINTYCISADAVELIVERCYTESPGAFFFGQLNISGGAAPFVQTTLRDNMGNSDQAGVSLNCKCPVYMEGNYWGYYVFVTPLAIPNICRVVARRNSANRDDMGQLFTGAGYPSMVDEANTTLKNGSVICPDGNPRQIVVSSSPFGVSACAKQVLLHNIPAVFTDLLPAQPLDGQIVEIKDTSGLASAINTITADGNGVLIDGAATATISSPYGSLSLTYNKAINKWALLSN